MLLQGAAASQAARQGAPAKRSGLLMATGAARPKAAPAQAPPPLRARPSAPPGPCRAPGRHAGAGCARYSCEARPAPAQQAANRLLTARCCQRRLGFAVEVAPSGVEHELAGNGLWLAGQVAHLPLSPGLASSAGAERGAPV